MSTGFEHNEKHPITFDDIDRHIQSFDLTPFAAQEAAPGSKAKRLLTTYTIARPVLLGVTLIPLIPETWRAALRVFMGTLDEVTAAFRTGSSDRTAGDPATGAQVEMEPKLPVG